MEGRGAQTLVARETPFETTVKFGSAENPDQQAKEPAFAILPGGEAFLSAILFPEEGKPSF